AFKFYVIEPYELVSIKFIIELRDAIFDQNRFFLVPRPSFKIPKGTEDIDSSVVHEKVTKEVVQQPKPELRKSKRNRTPKDFRHELQLYLIEGTRDKVLADLPPGCKPLGYEWIFKRKLKVDGTIEIFKTRLVIQGFRQKSRIDCFDTYALVARISTIRLLIDLASTHNLIIHQMDVKTAFVNVNWMRRFSMKDVGEADVILGIRIKHKISGIAIYQSRYTEETVSQLEYSKVIGCLMYVMTCTRPDIAFVVGKLSRYTSNPRTQCWQAIQRALKYLKKTMDYRLTYIGYPSVLKVTLMQDGSATLRIIRLQVARGMKHMYLLQEFSGIATELAMDIRKSQIPDVLAIHLASHLLLDVARYAAMYSQR
nr:zinc finger, CCHC-type [Tanacetum cinerariifolium]